MSDAPSKTGEFFRTIFYALAVALVIRVFLFQPFNIPSGSMVPTLLIGDFLFVSKYSYGYSRYSFPFAQPAFEGRVWEGAPERGDVIVFRLPQDGETDYIKRVVGLPGDRVQMIDGRLHINGEATMREPLGRFSYRSDTGAELSGMRYRETMPDGGPSYEILEMSDHSSTDDTAEFTVPDGHYFFMGDNRDNSRDSRVRGGPGFVPAEYLIGRADMLFLSTSGRVWEFWNWRLGRFLNAI